jgi:phosphatidylinositol-3-phosphatase
MHNINKVSLKIKWLAIFFVAAPSLASCVAAPAATHARPHVFLIVMENRSADQALTGAFTAQLAARYGEAANYHAVSHPSVPNYLALTSGQTWGVQDDSYRVLPRSDLGDQLSSAGVTWRAYMEGLGDGGCLQSPLPYDPGHNPFAFYGGRCPSNVVPLTALAGDLASSTPRFSWITPDRCHDTHDCSVSVGDDWLRQEATAIMQSAAWKADGVLFITWDEDDGSADNRVLTLVIAPRQKHEVSNRLYTHYSLLATIEDLMGVGRLANAAHASPMTDLAG